MLSPHCQSCSGSSAHLKLCASCYRSIFDDKRTTCSFSPVISRETDGGFAYKTKIPNGSPRNPFLPRHLVTPRILFRLFLPAGLAPATSREAPVLCYTAYHKSLMVPVCDIEGAPARAALDKCQSGSSSTIARFSY